MPQRSKGQYPSNATSLSLQYNESNEKQLRKRIDTRDKKSKNNYQDDGLPRLSDCQTMSFLRSGTNRKSMKTKSQNESYNQQQKFVAFVVKISSSMDNTTNKQFKSLQFGNPFEAPVSPIPSISNLSNYKTRSNPHQQQLEEFSKIKHRVRNEMKNKQDQDDSDIQELSQVFLSKIFHSIPNVHYDSDSPQNSQFNDQKTLKVNKNFLKQSNTNIAIVESQQQRQIIIIDEAATLLSSENVRELNKGSGLIKQLLKARPEQDKDIKSNQDKKTRRRNYQRQYQRRKKKMKKNQQDDVDFEVSNIVGNQDYRNQKYPKRVRVKPLNFWVNEKIQYRKGKAISINNFHLNITEILQMRFPQNWATHITAKMFDIQKQILQVQLNHPLTKQFQFLGYEFPYQSLIIKPSVRIDSKNGKISSDTKKLIKQNCKVIVDDGVRLHQLDIHDDQIDLKKQKAWIEIEADCGFSIVSEVESSSGIAVNKIAKFSVIIECKLSKNSFDDLYD